MKVLSVVGITKSGKTTTIENIIKELNRRQFSVGSVKEIHYENFAIDTEGTNTYRHKAAGAAPVTARGYNETDILFPSKLPVEKILSFYNQDYVLMEGVTDYNMPVILCVNDIKEIEQHKKEEYFGRVFAISGVAANKYCLKDFEQLPVINSVQNFELLADIIVDKVFELLPDFPPDCCNLCGYGCRGLSERILKGLSSREDCKLSEAAVTLSVDGKHIKIVNFVQDILKDTLIAIVGNLKGGKDGRKIELTINR
ncbi:MAG: molybdopterin-guanine dinucleotide biosynthesis protein MobB [Actinobacteria bacterium]|nr:molybdopterin-guanine dinucleotide biosynthesis protein MobB [Actinomycetota bacterium]